jgi:hypothetical protein
MKQLLREVRDIHRKNSTEISESLATCASKLSFIDRANLNILCLLAEEKDIDEERGNLGLTLT